MRRLLVIPLLATLGTVPPGHVLAQDRFMKPLSEGELSELLRNESDANTQNIFVTPGLLGKNGSRYYGPYDIKDLSKTKFGDWWVWHSRDEDISYIVRLASENKQLIAKHLSKSTTSRGAKIDFKGAEVSAVAEAYAHMCQIAFDVSFDSSQVDLIWAVQALPSQTKTVTCLDFGFFLAGHRIRLIDRDGLLVRRKE